MPWQRADSVIDGVAHGDAVASFELTIKQQQPALYCINCCVHIYGVFAVNIQRHKKN